MQKIKKRLQEAEREYDEKEISICKVISDYYQHTYKDVNKYMYRLLNLINMDIDEISVIGHSVAGVDIPYFKNIDVFTHYKAKWIVYYFENNEKQRIYNNLVDCGINVKNIVMKNAEEFYNV